MDNNEQKPDFDKKAEEIVTKAVGWYNSNSTFEGLKKYVLKGIEYVWFIHVEPLQKELTAEREKNRKLQDFKDYVHKRLDESGIPVDPDSPHKAAGCRIGGRLDVVDQLLIRYDIDVKDLETRAINAEAQVNDLKEKNRVLQEQNEKQRQAIITHTLVGSIMVDGEIEEKKF